jgi:hypothetical protein
VGIEHVLTGDAAQNPLAERLDDVLALLECRDVEAENRPAIFLGNGHVLRHVHKAAGEIARIRGLERRVRQTLPGAVRRDEVLQHGEPLAEV